MIYILLMRFIVQPIYKLKRYRKGKCFDEYYELKINNITVSSCRVEYVCEQIVRLYGVVTKSTYRRRGYAYMMLYRIMRSYRMRGYKMVLTSSECAEKLYENLGFTRKSIIWPEYEIQL